MNLTDFNFTMLIQPTIDFTLQFLNGSQFLNGNQYQTLITSIQALNQTILDLQYNLNSTDPSAQGNVIFDIGDLFSQVYPVNNNAYLFYQSLYATYATYEVIFTKPMEILYNLITYYNYVFSSMTLAVNCAYQGDFACTGYNFGYLVYTVFSAF